MADLNELAGTTLGGVCAPSCTLTEIENLLPQFDKVSKEAVEGEMNKKRLRPGQKALREIRKYQKGTSLVIRRAPFQRLVREIAKDVMPECQFSPNTLMALQECTEMYICDLTEQKRPDG